jgi:hypothetical protein
MAVELGRHVIKRYEPINVRVTGLVYISPRPRSFTGCADFFDGSRLRFTLDLEAQVHGGHSLSLANNQLISGVAGNHLRDLPKCSNRVNSLCKDHHRGEPQQDFQAKEMAPGLGDRDHLRTNAGLWWWARDSIR